MKFIIPGKPLTRHRPRFYCKAGKPFVFDDQSKEMNAIKKQMKAFMAESGEQMFDASDCIYVDFVFEMPIAKSLSKKKSAELVGRFHTNTPDIDNLIIGSYNCMTGIIYPDDRQICKTTAIKIYSETPQTIVTVSRIENVIPYT